MNTNPYAPPKATVGDVSAAPPRGSCPAQVTNAIKLWAASYCSGLLVIFVCWDYFSKLQPIGSLVSGQIFSLVISAWLYYKIYRGRNWARITLLVVVILGVIMTASGTFRSIVSEAPTLAQLQMFVAMGLNGVIIWLLSPLVGNGLSRLTTRCRRRARTHAPERGR